MSDPLRDRWQKDFANSRLSIRSEWLITDGDFVGISPDHANEPAVELYRGLIGVGYARGWL